MEFYGRKLTKDNFIKEAQNIIGETEIDFRAYFKRVINTKDASELEFSLTLLFALEKDNEFIDLIHQLLLEPWHWMYEELAHSLQKRKRPESIPFLREAMQKKYNSLESSGTGTRQFINQCGHALKSIGTEVAIKTIRDLSTSTDSIIKDEMMYRISRIEGRNDYKREY